MVSFHDNPEKYNNPAMLHNIDQEVTQTPALWADVCDITLEVLLLCSRIILVLNIGSSQLVSKNILFPRKLISKWTLPDCLVINKS